MLIKVLSNKGEREENLNRNICAEEDGLKVMV
jgi:hypothetical protein